MTKAAMVTTEIVRIGNSQGIRIPKAIREQAGLAGKVSMVVSGGTLIIRAARKPRSGWDDAFAKATQRYSDESLWPENLRNAFDDTEWTW